MANYKKGQSKWFEINYDFDYFKSRMKATNIKEAFNKSIKKWELECKGLQCRYGISTCGLCDLYCPDNSVAMPSDCQGCPIHIETNKQYCKGVEVILRQQGKEVVKYLKKLKLKYLKEETNEI